MERSPGTCGRSGRTTRAGSITARPPSCTRLVSTRWPPTSSNWPAPTRWCSGRANTWMPAGRCTRSTWPSWWPTDSGARDVLKRGPRKAAGRERELLGTSLAHRTDREKLMTARATFDFTGTTVLITGGTSGIGYATASLFRDAGARCHRHRHESVRHRLRRRPVRHGLSPARDHRPRLGGRIGRRASAGSTCW